MVDLLFSLVSSTYYTIIYIILIVSIIGIIAAIVMDILLLYKPYRIIIQICSILLLVFCSWSLGIKHETDSAYKKQLELQLSIKELEKKILISEQKAAEANSKVEIVYMDKIKVVKDVQVVTNEKIKNVEVKIDKDCKITTDTINILNSSARLKP